MTGTSEIRPETLMAYADGELGPIEAKRVERAVAADPTLAAAVERHRAFGARLRGAFAPIADAGVPPEVETLLRNAAQVTPLAPRRVSVSPKWLGAIAASLMIGLVVGQTLPRMASESGIAMDAGQMIARGDVARALDTQLASTQAADAPVRVGVTFRAAGGDLCRTFEHGAVGGIACSDGGDWRMARLYGGLEAQSTEFRQAGSAGAAMMADAQAMMVGEPLDAAGEAAALAVR
jgi:hypothetical protein